VSAAPAFETVGEQLVGRQLEKELVRGQQHFKPGQHHAVSYVSAVDGELEFCARLTYVDWMGHACVVVCVLGETGTWTPILIARGGQMYQELIRPAPASFKLSEKMLDALGVARTIVAVSDRPQELPRS
jgi:hypothetical protein